MQAGIFISCSATALSTVANAKISERERERKEPSDMGTRWETPQSEVEAGMSVSGQLGSAGNSSAQNTSAVQQLHPEAGPLGFSDHND